MREKEREGERTCPPSLSFSLCLSLSPSLPFCLSVSLSLDLSTSRPLSLARSPPPNQGFLFGFWGGCAVSIASAAAGAILVTNGCHYCCLPLVVRLQEKHARLNDLIHVLEGPAGFKIVALLRMTFIPFGLQNALFATASLSSPLYALATAVGVTPLVVRATAMLLLASAALHWGGGAKQTHAHACLACLLASE